MHITPTSERAGAGRQKARKTAIHPDPEVRNAPALAPKARKSHDAVGGLCVRAGDRRIRQAAALLPELVRVASQIHRGVALETAVLDAWRGLAGVGRWTAGMVRKVERMIRLLGFLIAVAPLLGQLQEIPHGYLAYPTIFGQNSTLTTCVLNDVAANDVCAMVFHMPARKSVV